MPSSQASASQGIRKSARGQIARLPKFKPHTRTTHVEDHPPRATFVPHVSPPSGSPPQAKKARLSPQLPHGGFPEKPPEPILSDACLLITPSFFGSPLNSTRASPEPTAAPSASMGGSQTAARSVSPEPSEMPGCSRASWPLSKSSESSEGFAPTSPVYQPAQVSVTLPHFLAAV